MADSVVLSFLDGLAAEAGALALEYYGRRQELAIGHKHPLDVVTDADREVERLVRERIRSTFPGDAFFGEESERSVSEKGRTWVVDPIDGTLNFVRGIDDWAVSIGVLERGMPIAGAIAIPARGLCVLGGKDSPARCNGESLPSCPHTLPADIVVGVGLGATTFVNDQLALMRGLGDCGYSFRRSGSSSVSLAMLARGRFDAFAALDVSAWDVAAGIAVVESLGFACSVDWRSVSLSHRLHVAAGPLELLTVLRRLIAGSAPA